MADDRPVVAPAQPWGEVYDLGYKHYSGPRLGRSHAVWALTLYSIKRGLGIKKRWTAKIIPFVLYMAAFIPAIIAAGILAFVPIDTFDFGYDQLNDITATVLFIFAAALGPEMLSDDRRENVLSLYFSRALTRLDYLLAKIAAMAMLMGSIAFGPPLLLFMAKVLLADDPIGYFFNHLDDAARILAHGVLVSAYLGAIALSVAAYTDRKGVASAIFIGGLFIVTGIANALWEALESSVRRYLILVSPGDLISAISSWIFNEPPGSEMADLPGVFYASTVVLVVAIAATVMYRRYLIAE